MAGAAPILIGGTFTPTWHVPSPVGTALHQGYKALTGSAGEAAKKKVKHPLLRKLIDKASGKAADLIPNPHRHDIPLEGAILPKHIKG